MRTELRYIELKSDALHSGPAWIARVQFSRSGRTVYFNGRALKRALGGGVRGNHIDTRTREEYWISGVKRNGEDRHPAGDGVVAVDAAIVDEYLAHVGRDRLNPRSHVITHDITPTDPTDFVDEENAPLDR
jgi:hypothetical protein